MLNLDIKLPPDLSEEDLDIHGNSIWNRHPILLEEINTFRKYCEEQQYKCFLDIGSNSGVFSMVYCTTVKNHECYAVDPVRYHINRLQEVAKHNSWNLHAHKLGMGDHEEMRVFETSHMANFHVTEETVNYLHKDEVQITTIDRFRDVYDLDIDCIKIDTEGFENQILRGAQSTLKFDHPDLFIETHVIESDMFGERADDIVDYLDPRSYNFFDHQNHPLEYKHLREYILSKNSDGFANQRFIARNRRRCTA